VPDMKHANYQIGLLGKKLSSLLILHCIRCISVCN